MQRYFLQCGAKPVTFREMHQGGLSLAVKDFIVRHITSVEQLELLLLFAADPQKSWSIPHLVAEIRSSQSSVQERLSQLAERGFIKHEGELFQYSPSSPERAARVQDVAAAYREYRVRVIELIYRGAGPLASFSDAFKFKPKD